jgi:hypothetical protein
MSISDFTQALMKDHLQEGGSDSRGTNIQGLVQAGVPLERARRQKSFSRPDVAWVNPKCYDFQKQRPDASAEEIAAKRRELSLQWKEEHPNTADDAANVTVPDRGDGAFAFRCDGAFAFRSDDSTNVIVPDRGDGSDGANPALHRDPEDMFWAGSVEWPVREPVLAALLTPGSDSLRDGTGIARKANKLRQEFLSQLVVQDVQDIPDSRVYEHRFSCTEMHYGVCATRDNAIYRDTLALAGSIERCLGQALVGKILRFYARPDNPEDNLSASRNGRMLGLLLAIPVGLFATPFASTHHSGSVDICPMFWSTPHRIHLWTSTSAVCVPGASTSRSRMFS